MLGETDLASDSLPDGSFRGLSLAVVDAVFTANEETLELICENLQRRLGSLSEEDRGRAKSLIDVASWGLERITPHLQLAELRVDAELRATLLLLSHRSKFLDLNQEAVARAIGGPEKAEQALNKLKSWDMCVRRDLASKSYWEITPRGQETLRQVL